MTLIKLINTIFTFCLLSAQSSAKEIALTFDDAPMGPSAHFGSVERTEKLIQKLDSLKIPQVMIFANPCKRKDSKSVLGQLGLYAKQGHLIENHTCSHPRLDEVGFEIFSKDLIQAEGILSPLFEGEKFFRFPYLNESRDPVLRNQMRDFLKANSYRNAMVSVDTDDYLFAFKLNEAKKKNLSIDYKKVEELFVKHIVGAARFYDDLARETLGYSPKHVLLLHENDANVLFLEAAVKALRSEGWKIIGTEEAYKDPLYKMAPQSTYANNGIIAQVNHDKTGLKKGYFVFEDLDEELDQILGLDSE